MSISWPLILAGACIGSFLNVVVWRLPRQESVVWPGSHCPSCGSDVRWHDNIPVLGWMFLRGRCRDCGWSIPARYPLVELLSAALWLSASKAIGFDSGTNPALNLTAGLLLVSLLLPLTLIDLDHLWLPEPLCRAGVITGLIFSGIAALGSPDQGSSLIFDHLLGACAGLMVLERLSAFAEAALGQPALGLGDAKLAALGGAWLGLQGIGIALFLAILGGAVIGSIARLIGRLGPREPFPFGPFIATGIWLVWLMGPAWWWQEWLTVLGS
ncbi:MAG: prepilin peptidase [Synechococcus sp.]|nr:prepilin peptidase [Synechococcus sp.]